MKFRFFLMAFLVPTLFVISSCQEEENEWDFDYPKAELCNWTWSGSEYKLDGNWIDITRKEYKELGLQFTILFRANGTYYGTGYFGTGDGTYEAHGKTIKTYVSGSLYLTYIVHWLRGEQAEITMRDNGGTTLDFRVTRQQPSVIRNLEK